ncbi:YihY/virulence factor BrkB family protein [Alkalibacterium iburiense]
MMLSYKNIKKNVPKKDWIKEISMRIREGEIWQHSTFVTYYVLLTTFPLLVGIINGIRAFGGTLQPIAWFIYRIVPGPLSEIIVEDMLQVFESSHVGIFIIAAVSTVWTVSWIMAAILMGLNKAYGVGNRKNVVTLRFLAFLQTFVVAAWIGFIIFFIRTFTASSLGRWAVFVPLVFISFCLMYYYVPNVVQQFKQVIPGALFSTTALLIGVFGYRLYLSQLPDDSTFFTMTGSFMIMLALLQKMCLAILAGGTINATFMQMRSGDIVPKNENSKFIKLINKTKIAKRFEE